MDKMYSILRFGKKIKSLQSVKGFQAHMQREKEVLNADLSINNEILIGDGNVYENTKEYIKDVKLRANNVLAREILQTASPGFFKELINYQKAKWININRDWLKKNFGENCIYSILHKDESTWHIHSLIIPKFLGKNNEPILSNTRYFDGVEKMRAWQDNYANSMNEGFKQLSRGIKYSKAKHLNIRQFYTLLNEEINEKDVQQLIAKAKQGDLLGMKIKAMERTLEAYKRYNINALMEKEGLSKDNKELNKELQLTKEENEVYKQAINLLAKHNSINEEKVQSYISQGQERGR